MISLAVGCTNYKTSGPNENMLWSSDSIPSPTKTYDDGLIDVINHQWEKTMDESNLFSHHGERAVIRFKLHSDGHFSDITVAQPSTNQEFNSLCINVISTVSTYKPWSADMKRLIGIEYRDVTLTFNNRKFWSK